MDNQNPDNQNNSRPNLGDISPPADKPDNPPPPPAPQPPRPDIPQVTSNNQKPKKKWPKILAAIIIMLLAGAGWYYYVQSKNDDGQSAAKVENKNIDKLDVGILDPDYGEIYPDISVANSYAYLTNSQMFEGLVRYEDKNKIVPWLATDWSNPDNTTWVFNLKKGVKFHNGSEMTAEDVKYSIDKIKSADTDFSQTFTSTIGSVKVVNDDQVQVKTTEPDPTLLNRLAFLYVIDDDASTEAEPSLAGTGPYQIRPGTETTKTNVSMVAYEEYHGGEPKTKAVNFGAEKDAESLVEAFKDGKYNIVGEIPVDQAQSVTGASQFITSEPEVAYLGLNSINPGPLKKKKVREAIRYAVDPVKLGEAEGDKVTPLSQLIPESLPGHNPTIPAYKRDVDKAKKLLEEAGYPDGVTIKLTHASDPKFSDELVKELKEANITLEVDRQEDFNAFIDFFLSGKAEMYYVTYSSDTLDGLDMYTTILTPKDYKSSELNTTLDEASGTIDPEERLKLLQDAAAVIDEDVAIIPLSTRDNLWLMDRDYDITQDMPSSFLSVYFYKTQLK